MMDIPEDFDDPWYRGAVHVGYKDTVYEPSSPICHMIELFSIVIVANRPGLPWTVQGFDQF